MKKISLIFNILIIIFVIYSMIIAYFKLFGPDLGIRGIAILKYYTNISNIFAAIISSISLYYIIKNINYPKWLIILKLSCAGMLTLTFLVVMLYLAPFTEAGFQIVYHISGAIFVHVINPILFVIDFLLIKKINKLKIKYSFISLIPSILYLIITFIIVINVGDKYAPYPFLEFNGNKWYVSLISIIALAGIIYLVNLLYIFLYNKIKCEEQYGN